MDIQAQRQFDESSSRLRSAMPLALLLSVALLTWLIAACAPAPAPTTPAPTESPLEMLETPATAPVATAAEAPLAPADASVPLTTELKATVVAGLPPTPVPQSRNASPWGEMDVGVLPLSTDDPGLPLWAVFSVGMGFGDLEQGPFVAIYSHGNEGWREIHRLVLTPCVEYVGYGSLVQVQLEPSQIWLEMQAGTGAHGGCYELLSFDGNELHSQATNLHSNPDAGFLQDLNHDGIQEVILDRTEDYVFCYACGVRLVRFRVLRWDGARLIAVELAPLPEAAPDDLRHLNNRAVELAQGGLWKDAQATIHQALPWGASEPSFLPTVTWNAALIDMQAGAQAEQVSQSPYPLLDNMFYGDYAAALDVFRPYGVEEIWGPETPLIAGTASEGWEFELTNWISWTTNSALKVQPDLAPAYFLRGWGTHVRSPGNPQAVADVQYAADLIPDDPLFSDSAAHLQVPISPAPPAEVDRFHPPSPEVCYELGQAMMQTLNMTVTLSEVFFEDHLLGATGTGCQAIATGTGADFGILGEVVGNLKAMLEARGWHEDVMYAADGPTGSATAVRKDGSLCLLDIGWRPSDDADCPPDQPISACELSPEQRLYTITLNCAEQTSSTPSRMPTTTPVAQAQDQERWEVRTLLVGPGDPGRLYALFVDESHIAWPAGRARLLVSDDSGQTWLPFPGGLPMEDCVRNVNLDYATPDGLYASTCYGLYRWSGTDWDLVSPRETEVVAIAYGQPETIWATDPFASGGTVVRSDDGGSTWNAAGQGLISFNGVANLGIDPRDPNTLYAIIWPKYGGSYLRRGTAQGVWQTMPTPMDNAPIGTGMTIDGATGALYVIAWKWPDEHFQLWRSRNPTAPDMRDIRWELVHDFGGDVQVELLASGHGPAGLALYTNVWPVTRLEGAAIEIGGAVVHHSLDEGQTWSPLPIP